MKILLADDHDLVSDTIAAFLRAEIGADVVTAPDLEAALQQVDTNGAYDLVLLDYGMPGMNGLSGLRRMIDVNEGKPVAILSGMGTKAVAYQAVGAGAAGYIPKTLPSRAIANAVNFMASGGTFMPVEYIADETKDTQFGLTRRELQVLSGLCEGLSNKEIARALDLQEVTVKLHVKTLSRKLDARNRTHAAMIARTNSLV